CSPAADGADAVRGDADVLDGAAGQVPGGCAGAVGRAQGAGGRDRDRGRAVGDPPTGRAHAGRVAPVERGDGGRLAAGPVRGEHQPPRTGAAVGHRPPMATYLVSRNSSLPTLPPSRPRPECWTPPKGAAGLDTRPWLRPTMPVCRASVTRRARCRSRV